jgi:hypothetical protein
LLPVFYLLATLTRFLRELPDDVDLFTLPFFIWMLEGYFDTIPIELDEPANREYYIRSSEGIGASTNRCYRNRCINKDYDERYSC